MAIVTEMAGESSVVSPALAAVNSSSQTTAHAGTSNVAQESEMQRIVDMISKLKLNPLAKEFIPSSYSTDANRDLPQVMFVPADNGAGGFVPVDNNASGFVPFDNNSGGFVPLDSNSGGDGYPRRRRNNFDQGRRRNGRPFRAQRGDSIRRTVYVSDIDQFVTEEDLANLFSGYGQVVDCRVCGDPHSRLRFAFVEFADEQSARGALNLGGTMLGFSPVRVLPSKTAILPVNPVFLPRSEDERAMCARTVYCTNIDKRVTQADVKTFFETRCGEVSRLRLLGDQVHSTRIAFVEFAMAESAVLALDCCGQLLGTHPIRVSPSKTPVRARVARPVA